MSAPVVTAVIPTHRRPRLLRRAILSVLRQTYPHVRALVCDNASGDETESVVRELMSADARVIYHQHATDLGARANFQFGMDAVESEFFSFLSDDDFLLPDFYRLAVEAFERHPGARFFCAQTIVLEPRSGARSLSPRGRWAEGFYPAGHHAARMCEQLFLWTACVFAADVRRLLGPLPAIPAVDLLYMVSAAALFPFVVAMKPGAVFTELTTSASATMSVADLGASYGHMQEHCAELPGVPAEDRDELRRALDRSLAANVRLSFQRALAARDWERLEDAARFLRARDVLGGKERVLAFLARHRGSAAPALWLARGLDVRARAFRRLRKSGWKRCDPDEFLQ